MGLCETGSQVFLCGDGVSETLVENMASRLSLASWPDCNHPPARFDEENAAKAIALIANVDSSCLARVSKRVHCSYFEISELDDRPSARFIDWVTKNGNAYSLTTKTAYRVPVAHHICNGLARHLRMSKHKRESIELALHEAVVNAAIHGNLAINQAHKNSMEGIAEFYRMSEERVADPRYACLRVEILAHWQDDFIEFRVIDQGPGFHVEEENEETAPWKGLNLISSLADSVVTSGGGNNLTMKFAR